jgi:enterochelin esterase-like enzyme
MPFGLVTAGIGLVIVLGAIFVLRRTRQRIRARRTWRTAASVVGTLTLVTGLGVGVNAYVGWVPNLEGAAIRAGLPNSFRPEAQLADQAPDADQLGDTPITSSATPVASALDIPAGLDPSNERSARGGIGRFVLPAPKALNMPGHDVLIYTPPAYDPSGAIAYPVIYLAHGSPGSAADWMAAGAPAVVDALIAAREIPPVILVSPGLHAVGAAESGCLDATKPGGSQVESYLYTVVLPWVENHLPVALDRRYTAIGGMSMGGYCAVDQGLRHNETFSTILSMLPYGEPGAAGHAMKSSQAEVDAVTPLKYIETREELDEYPVATWFGVDAPEVNKRVGLDAQQMAAALRLRGQVVEIYVEPVGGHTWTMAIASLPAGLRFWGQQMAADAD